MARSRNDRKSALISEEAAEWFVRLRDDNLGPDERRRYVRWLKQSSTHTAEMLRVRQLAHWLREAKLERLLSHQGSKSNVIEFSARPPIAGSPGGTSDRESRESDIQ
jgi:ferric-dicitrate binding protein FerR (iron transport regulator)